MGRGDGDQAQLEVLRRDSEIEDYQLYRSAFTEYIENAYKMQHMDELLRDKARHWEDMLTVMDRLDPKVAAQMLSVFSTTRDMQLLNTQSQVRSQGKRKMNEAIIAADLKYLEENHPQLLQRFSADDHADAYANMFAKATAVGGAWGVLERAEDMQEREQINRFLALHQMCKLQRVRSALQLLPDPPKQLMYSLEKFERSLEQENIRGNVLVEIDDALKFAAAIASSLHDPAYPEKVPAQKQKWDETLSQYSNSESLQRPMFNADLALIRECNPTAHGCYQYQLQMALVAAEHDQPEHLVVHELIHSRQRFLNSASPGMSASFNELVEFEQKLHTPSFEGMTELATHYLMYGEVNFNQGTGYPAYVLAAQSLQEVCGKDQEWMIDQSFSCANAEEVAREAFHSAPEPAVFRSLYTTMISELQQECDLINHGNIADKKYDPKTDLPSYTPQQISYLQQKREQLRDNFRAKISSYGYYNIGE